MRLKGVSPLIGFVLVILIAITAAGIVLTVGQSTINRARDSGIVGEASQNVRLLDNLIKEVAAEGSGGLRSFQIRVTDGTYRVDATSGIFEYTYTLKSDIFTLGTFKKEGTVTTQIIGSSASASQNSTHLILENEILEVVQPKIGSQTNFAGINTTTAISSIRLKESGATIVPFDTRVIIENITNTSWGLGYSKLAFEGSNLPKVESVFHVRSNLTNLEYEVIYTLRASTDFLLINVRNVSSTNKTTIVLGYKLGTTAGDDIIRIGDINETAFANVQ